MADKQIILSIWALVTKSKMMYAQLERIRCQVRE